VVDLSSSFLLNAGMSRIFEKELLRAKTTVLPGFKNIMLDIRPKNKVVVSSILATLGAFAWACISSTHVYLIEQSVCRSHFMLNDPSRINRAGLVAEENCKIADIQAHVASLNGIYLFLAFLPGR
jgi:hypothetical protein